MILLQIAMVSPGTHFMKNRESRPEPMSPSPKANESYDINSDRALTEP